MKIDLNDKVALVTGSAHRVGKAIALELARHGVHILVHYHGSDESAVRETLHEIKSLGVDAFAVKADISAPEGVEAVFAAVREHFGRLDILVNSASIFQKNTLMEVSREDWQRSLDVNLTAPLLCTQAAVRLMRDNTPPGGAIINICDYGSVRPWVERVDHGVSKAALLALTEVSAASLGAENIRVNGVLPGPVMKPNGLSDERWAEIAQSSPLRRTGAAEDVARAVAFLASEDFITGAILPVNGGETL
jgi:NAD(P)-dependent dehydrogenase (short-subunit alcohol dehydrogenase family)